MTMKRGEHVLGSKVHPHVGVSPEQDRTWHREHMRVTESLIKGLTTEVCPGNAVQKSQNGAIEWGNSQTMVATFRLHVLESSI